jgi:hypothetical protein
VHLRAERVRHLVVLRAHTLTYVALRKVADHAHDVGARLWLVVHRERPPAAVAQLLEGLPHETAPLPDLLALTPELADDDRQSDLPLGAGRVYPYLAAIHDVYEPLPRRRVRSTLTRDLSRANRAEWLDQDAADAILALARRGDTASEIYVRIRIRARRLPARRRDHQRARRRPDRGAQLRRSASVRAQRDRGGRRRARRPDPRSAARRRSSPSPPSPVTRTTCVTPTFGASPATAGSSSDPTAACSPSRPSSAASWLPGTANASTTRTAERSRSFAGNSHGRISQPMIGRRLARLDAPGTLREDPPDTTIGEGPSADGRAMLLHLTAWHLWHELEHDAA